MLTPRVSFLFFAAFLVVVISAGCSTNKSHASVPEKCKVRGTDSDLRLSYVPGGLAFYKGTDDHDLFGDDEDPLPSFWIAETETTNSLVCEVFQWAYANGRINGSAVVNGKTVSLYGQELLDLDGKRKGIGCGIKFQSNRFTVREGLNNHPCTYVTWFGAVMFCNWLTEMIDGSSKEVVYAWNDTINSKGIALPDHVWQDSETVADKTKKGFRLPESAEWELAARFINDSNGDNDITDTGEYYPGNHVSGDMTSYCDPLDEHSSKVFGNYAWYRGNSFSNVLSCDYGLHAVGTAGTGKDICMEKSVSGASANALGLYDMSGNVWEWCFTGQGAYRILRGGSWNYVSHNLQVGAWFFDYAAARGFHIGFRPVRSD